MEEDYQFTWNKEKKKFVSPTGTILTGPQVLDILNNMLAALTYYTDVLSSIDHMVRTALMAVLEGEDADGDSDSGEVVNESAVGSEGEPS